MVIEAYSEFSNHTFFFVMNGEFKMKSIRIENFNNPFVFEDTFCSSKYSGKISYSGEPSQNCDIAEISLQSKTKQIKKEIQQRKLFRTVTVEVTESVTEHYINLAYRRNGIGEYKTINIHVLPSELSYAKAIIQHIEKQLAKHSAVRGLKKIKEDARLAELRREEEVRLAQCIYDVVVIDFETTGIKSPLDSEKYDEVLSVSIIDQDGNVLLNSLCKPQRRKTWAKAEEIHGISPAMVKDQPTFEEIFPTIKEILYKSKVVVAYNIAFEMRFLWGFDLEFGKPGGTQLIRNVVWGPDPMLMYSAYKGNEKWQKLSSAAKHFKYKFDAHDSLEDVKATLHCYKKLLEYVENNPDKNYIIKYGFLYDDGKKGRWFNYNTYDIDPNCPVDYADSFRAK